MSVIIRLQNLPWSANAGDIRSFFKGLGIPDGGVHIVGGENGDAFIAFSTDEDARQAMALNGGRLKETQVTLLLSSRAEMQKVIETARQQTVSFMSFTAETTAAQQLADQKAAAAKQVAAHIAAQAAAAQLPKPQPPVITSSSLSGILAQQMFQQHQIQFMNHGNIPNMMTQITQPNELNHPASLPIRGVPSPVVDDRIGNKSSDDYRRVSRSRSKSRERRSRRSRSRERSSRRRRSRSSERRSSRKQHERSRDQSSDRNRGGSSRGRGRSSYDRDQSSSGSTTGTTNNGHGTKNNASDDISSAPKHAIPNQMLNTHQAAPVGIFSGMGNVPMMNPMVQPPIVQFPFGAPPPMIPTPNQRGMPIENNPMNNSFPNAAAAYSSNTPTFSSDPQTSAVRMVNIDSSFHYSSIRKFFAGLHIPKDGIKLINDEFGNRRGEAVIRFARPLIAQRALEKNGFNCNGSIIQVFLIDEADYNKEVDSFRPTRPNFYDKNENSNNKNYSMNSNPSMSNQPPANRYPSRRDNEEPLDLDAVYNRTDQFGRRIRTEEEIAKHTKSITNIPPPIVTHIVEDDEDDVVLVSDSSNCTVLLIEDLPTFTSEQDIMKMFSDFTLLHIVLARKPKHFHAYVKFLNKEDAAIALKVKYNHRIGYKQVFVSECTDQAYEQAKAEFSIDPIPVAQSPLENQIADDMMRSEKSMDEGPLNKYPRSQLFQKQFVEPTPSMDMPFGSSNINSNAMNYAEMGPPSSNDTMPNKFAVNNSDPRRRKQLENDNDNQTQKSDFGNFQNKSLYGDSHHNTKFGESNPNAGFDESYQNTGNRDTHHKPGFGNAPQFDGFNPSFNNFGNNQDQPFPYNRNNQGGNNNFNANVQPQRPSDPRQKRNPFLQPPTQQQQQPPQQEEQPNQQSNDSGDTPFLFLSNVDFRSSVEEIRAWFAEISVFPKEIYRLTNFRGLPNGKCVFLCNSPQEANLALAKNRLQFRSRMVYINLMPVNQAAEALATLGVVIDPNELSCGPVVAFNQQRDGNQKNIANKKQQEPDQPTKKVPNHKNPFMRTPKLDPIDDGNVISDSPQNQDEDLNEEDINEDENEEQDEVIDNGEEEADGDFENTELVDNDENNCQDDNQHDNGPMINNYDNNGPPFNRNMRHNNQHYNRGGNHMMMNHGMNPNMNNNNHPPPSQRNTNGCVVALRNVPFQANAIDIMRFFNNFQMGPDDIIRRYRDDGSPTGDARVCFASPMDAMAAVEQCQNGRIMNRIVQLMLFS